jgi:hypothetical protein
MASATNIKAAAQKSNAAFANLVKAMGNSAVNLQAVKNNQLPPAVTALRNLKALYAQAPANVAANVFKNNTPKTPEAAVVNALAHLRNSSGLAAPAVINAAAYVAATNIATQAKNRKVGRFAGMYRNPQLRKFWKNVNALLKTPNTPGGPKINVLGPKARAAINWVKAHPRLTALGAGLPALAVPAAAAFNIGAATKRRAAAVGAAAMAPGAITAEIRDIMGATPLETFFNSNNGKKVLRSAVNAWAATQPNGMKNVTPLGKVQAMVAAYKGTNANAKKAVTNAIQKGWAASPGRVAARFKYNVTKTSEFMNAVSKLNATNNKNKNLAEFKSRPFWTGSTNNVARAASYWKQNNLSQNKVFKNRTATGASLANFWAASNALSANALGPTGNANANKLRARKKAINDAWKRANAAMKRQEIEAGLKREQALRSLFTNVLSKENKNAIIKILNDKPNKLPGVSNAKSAALTLRRSDPFTRAAGAVKFKFNASINKTNGLKNTNREILKAFVEEFSKTAPVTKTGGFLGIGRRTEGGQKNLSTTTKLRIPVSTAANILNQGNKGWGNTAVTNTEKIDALLAKYPPDVYDWKSLIAALPAANTITNVLKKSLRAAIAARPPVNFGLP